MKKIPSIAFFLFFPVLLSAKKGPDPVRSWWNAECLQRGPLTVIDVSDEGNFDLGNETCKAGNTFLDLLERAKKTDDTTTTEKDDTTSENDINNEWKNSVDAAHVVTPAKPDQLSSEGTVLGKLRSFSSKMSILGELHAACTFYQRTTSDKTIQKQKIIQKMIDNRSLLNESKKIQDDYSPVIEHATKLFSTKPEIIKYHGTSERKLNWLGTGKLLGCERVISSLAAPLASTAWYLVTTYSSGLTLYNNIDRITEFNNGKNVPFDRNGKAVYTNKNASNFNVKWNNLDRVNSQIGALDLNLGALRSGIDLVGNLYGLGSSSVSIYSSITKSDQYFNTMLPIYTANHKLLKAAFTIKELSEKHPELKNMQSLPNIQKLEEKMSENKDLRETIELLKSDPDSWWAHNKEALVTLLDKHKDELAGIYEMVGEFESYVTLAEAKNKLESEGHPVTFSEFTNDSAPFLSMHNFWNPLLDPKKAVANSMSIGGSKGSMRHMILTGSNTGGKSTLLKAAIVNTILSQTYGIAFADKMKHTHFDNVLSSLNINDNTADGDSLFMSEVKRAKNILEKINHGNSLVVCDELFNGTSAQNAGRAAAKVLEVLSNNPSTLSLFATHHGPTVTNLGKLHPFRNFKMDATRGEDGKIRYTYKLKPGISTENIADDILKEHIGI